MKIPWSITVNRGWKGAGKADDIHKLAGESAQSWHPFQGQARWQFCFQGECAQGEDVNILEYTFVEYPIMVSISFIQFAEANRKSNDPKTACRRWGKGIRKSGGKWLVEEGEAGWKQKSEANPRINTRGKNNLWQENHWLCIFYSKLLYH